jgi:hypothetical protein
MVHRAGGFLLPVGTDQIDYADMVIQAFWLEVKTTLRELLPYAMLIALGVAVLAQQERLVNERLDGLRAEINEQTAVLEAIRDQLRTSGLVVPPFRTTPSDD